MINQQTHLHYEFLHSNFILQKVESQRLEIANFDSTISDTCKTAGHILVPGMSKMRENNPVLRVSV